MKVPQRIQLSRKKGYRKPPGAVVVARPSKWGNPYKVVRRGRMWEARTDDSTTFTGESKRDAAYWAAMSYRAWWGARTVSMEEIVAELAGKDLACWCPLDWPCHADVLLELANREEVSS